MAARMYLPRSPPMFDNNDDDSSAPSPAFGPDTALTRGDEEESKIPPENSAICASADRPSLGPRAPPREGSEVPTVAGPEGAHSGCGDGARRSRMDLVGGGDLAVGGQGAHSPRRRWPYWRLKNANSAYCARRAAMLSTPTFEAWLVAGRDKQEFSVDENCVVPLAQPAPCPPGVPPPTLLSRDKKNRSLQSHCVTSNQ